MSGQITGISNTVGDLEDEFYRLLDENDPDIEECLKSIYKLQHMLILFETRVRNHRERIILQNLKSLQERMQMLSINVADVVFKPPNVS